LVITKQEKQMERQQYVALSYCWGNTTDDAAITTEENIGQRLQGIAIQSLPKTIQNAITITRQLGVQYLWVDALCIIQRSEEDWQRECSNMSQIYRNALFTIAASASDNSQGGCEIATSPLCLVSSLSSAYGNRGRFLVEPEPAIRTFGWPDYPVLLDEPLQKRGWCLQERHLSQRIIHFTTEGLLWECRSGKASNMTP
jgi:hypothetical protein